MWKKFPHSTALLLKYTKREKVQTSCLINNQSNNLQKCESINLEASDSDYLSLVTKRTSVWNVLYKTKTKKPGIKFHTVLKMQTLAFKFTTYIQANCCCLLHRNIHKFEFKGKEKGIREYEKPLGLVWLHGWSKRNIKQEDGVITRSKCCYQSVHIFFFFVGG